ncbi:MAG: DUF459 domain-containing protein [Acidimicrobiia bacterium]
MADSELDQSESRVRSAQRQRKRSQTRKRYMSAALATLVVVLAALWFSDTLRIPTDGPTLAGGISSVKTPSNGDQSDSGSNQPEHRAINPLQPMRLWIGGDSLAGALGPSLGQITAATGVVQPQYDSRVGSGLISGDIDWPKHAQEQMNQLNPEVAVFIIGANDANVYDDSLASEYAQKVEEMMRILVGPGREVYWVNAPVMRDESLEKNVKKVDEIQRAVAATIPQVTFVDAHTLFADETGDYQSSLPDNTGKVVVMRAGDGIHLTGAGGDHLARAIFKQLDPQWRILEQAVPSQPKKVIVTRGSTQVPGSGGSSGSSSGTSGSGSSSYRHSGSGATLGTTPSTLAQPTQTTQATTASTVPSSTSSSTPPPGP